MGRKRRQSRSGGGRGGGALTSLRGRFRSTVQGVAGGGDKRPTSPARRILGNVLTIALLLATAWLLLRRFGVLQ
jgi:hypothetical protein